ncbi:MAG: hypothetical protein JEZ11_17050 [Desulfobacterales bacterium]|nr:hypothetical protein [Desulfobacterales bacterium]
MTLRTCVLPTGRFFVGVHKPTFSVHNHRCHDHLTTLGCLENGTPVINAANFPPGDLKSLNGDWVYEIANPLPFRGVTYIARAWAEKKAGDPASICLPRPPPVSFARTAEKWFGHAPHGAEQTDQAISTLPRPLQLALATTSTDPADLVCLAKISATFVFADKNGEPTGLAYRTGDDESTRPAIEDPHLFDAVANNRHLPDHYKRIMALRPGVQGGSEIVGEFQSESSHIFEYLRTNSYIPGGHYAANLADDAVRYGLEDLGLGDMTGLRHLFYQRTFIRLAEQLSLATPEGRRTLTGEELETLRLQIGRALSGSSDSNRLALDGILWGWNFGYDYAPSDYRLHASHQQIHQQYALVPEKVYTADPQNPKASSLPAYACGDLVADFVRQYRRETGRGFFETYEKAIRENRRTDGRNDLEASLLVHADDQVMIFVPKAQTSQWEIQIMPLHPVGNVAEADGDMRSALDRALWIAARVLSALGARMITGIEFSKRIGEQDPDQRLLYSLLPRLPQSPGAFSEAQLRWINGHYPEDFARACRNKLAEVTGSMGGR